MALRYIRHAVIGITSAAIAGAQQTSRIVPTDLQSGFETGTEVQVSYTGEAVNGFRDGTVFEKDAVAQVPTFALGDSSGITPSTLYTIIMVDTTCPSALTLHYARANFKNNFDITNINSSSAALLDYKAPGAFGELGDDRQYSFLMYINPGRREITDLRLPQEGQQFDVKQFQNDNSLPDASAGVGMVVKLGGQADCGDGDEANTRPASLATPRPARSTALLAGSSSTSDATLSRTAPAPTSSADDTSQSSGGASGNGTGAGQSGTLARPTATSTLNLATVPPGVSGSPTSSANLAEQTASAGSRVFLGSSWMLAPLLAVALW